MMGSLLAVPEPGSVGFSGEFSAERSEGSGSGRRWSGLRLRSFVDGDVVQRLLILLTLAALAMVGMLLLVKGDAHARRKHALAASLPAYAVDRLYAHQDGDVAQYDLALMNAEHAVSAFHGSASSESELSLAQTLALHLNYAKYCRWRTQNDSRSSIQETWKWCTDAHENFDKLSEERVREIAAGR